MKSVVGCVSLLCITLVLPGVVHAENFINYGGDIYVGSKGSWVGGNGAYQTFSTDSGTKDGNNDTIYSQTGARTQIDDHHLNLNFNSWGGVAGTTAAGNYTTMLRGGQHVVNNRNTTGLYEPTMNPFGNTKHRVNGATNAVDSTPDAYQFRVQEEFISATDPTYGDPNYGIAFTPHVQKSGFLLGGDSADTDVAFADSLDSFAAEVNLSHNFAARAIVQHRGSWYVSSSSTTGPELTFNAYTESWYTYDPTDSLFSNTAGRTADTAGSTFTDIDAVGVLIENSAVTTTSEHARIQSLESLVIKGNLTPIPELGGFGIYSSAILLIYMVSRRRRIAV